MPTIKIEHKEDGRRGIFELFEDGIQAGEMTYVWAGSDKFIIDHTETFEGFNGKGYARMLVLRGIEYAKEKGVKIVPLCPYAKKVMEGDNVLKEMIF